MSLAFAVNSFFLFLIPKTRKNFVWMNVGCVLIYASVYIEKGIALIIPGFTPDQLGQVYAYVPSATELRVAAGVFGVGFLLFTLMVKVSVSILFEREQPAHA
jgi:molybdopterin-containing oxidoreductase family membrane subunit